MTGVAVTCSQCAAVAEEEGARLSWSTASTPRATTWTCPACTRANVRSIEAKLEEEWW